jgi:hypothetical protein
MSLKDIKHCLQHEAAIEICMVLVFGTLLYALVSPFVGMY